MDEEAPILGLALGSGSARGWAHLGVFRALKELGIEPQVVCGASVGALVGAAWASKRLRLLERWALSLRRRDVLAFLDLNLRNSLIKGERLYRLFDRYADLQIESLPRAFATVATDFETGEALYFKSGSVIDAVRASMSMPGLLPPVAVDGRLLMDGGLADPIPVRLCRELGATRVIAVNLNRGIVQSRASRRLAESEPNSLGDAASEDCDKQSSGRESDLPESTPRALAGAMEVMGDRLDDLKRRVSAAWEESAWSQRFANDEPTPAPPGLYDSLVGALHILQDRVARSRLEQDAPDVELCPELGGIAMLEVYRAEEALAEGYRVTLEAADLLRALSEDPGSEGKGVQ